MDAWLQCEVGTGQLGSEFSIRLETAEGQPVTLFAAPDVVKFQEAPSGWDFVPGALKVERIQNIDGEVLIKLPAESFELGYVVRVRRSQLDANPQFQRA